MALIILITYSDFSGVWQFDSKSCEWCCVLCKKRLSMLTLPMSLQKMSSKRASLLSHYLVVLVTKGKKPKEVNKLRKLSTVSFWNISDKSRLKSPHINVGDLSLHTVSDM